LQKEYSSQNRENSSFEKKCLDVAFFGKKELRKDFFSSVFWQKNLFHGKS